VYIFAVSYVILTVEMAVKYVYGADVRWVIRATQGAQAIRVDA